MVLRSGATMKMCTPSGRNAPKGCIVFWSVPKGPTGELRVSLFAEDGWWGLVAGPDGVRWIRAEDLCRSRPVPSGRLKDQRPQ